MLCFILFLLQSFFRAGNAENVIALGQVNFDGSKRGPEIEVEGSGNRVLGINVEKANQYYVENVKIVQDDIAMRWPLGIVPYYFDMASYDYVMNSRTREAMDIIEAVSCIRFTSTLLKPYNNSWIHITNPEKVRECMHKPIYKGYEVIVHLGLECLTRREIVHTLLHAIGFRDEVTHPQRDQYIRVIWENIQPRYKPLFRRQLEEGPLKSLVEYDPMSIMQFHDRAYSRNGFATIAGLLPGLQIRPSEGLSQLDKMKLRLVFGHECNRRSVDDLLDTCKREFRSDQPDQRDQSGMENDGTSPASKRSTSSLTSPDGTANGGAAYDGAGPDGASFEGAVSVGDGSNGNAPDDAISNGAISKGSKSNVALISGSYGGGAYDDPASDNAASDGAQSDDSVRNRAPLGGFAYDAYDGVPLVGVASDGAASDGAASDGAASDGAASDGAASDGAAPNFGAAHNGVDGADENNFTNFDNNAKGTVARKLTRAKANVGSHLMGN